MSGNDIGDVPVEDVALQLVMLVEILLGNSPGVLDRDHATCREVMQCCGDAPHKFEALRWPQESRICSCSGLPKSVDKIINRFVWSFVEDLPRKLAAPRRKVFGILDYVIEGM